MREREGEEVRKEERNKRETEGKRNARRERVGEEEKEGVLRGPFWWVAAVFLSLAP